MRDRAAGENGTRTMRVVFWSAGCAPAHSAAKMG